MRRAIAVGAAILLLVSGCAATVDYDPDTAIDLQDRVLSVTTAVAAEDFATADTALDELTDAADDARDAETITADRHDDILAAAALVRADVESALAAEAARAAEEQAAEEQAAAEQAAAEQAAADQAAADQAAADAQAEADRLAAEEAARDDDDEDEDDRAEREAEKAAERAAEEARKTLEEAEKQADRGGLGDRQGPRDD